MKLLLLLVCLVPLVLAQTSPGPFSKSLLGMKHREPPIPAQKSARAVTSAWITQKLDHFDTSNKNTYRMRYFANDEFYQPGGPIFIYVGGEWEINEGSILGGHVYDMAREMNGYLFYTEHRYYGQSHPTDDLTSANMKYLDIDQALEDIAHFIRYQKVVVEGASSSGVILVGGSYAGTMVAWFKQRHPALANGAWSSSAPLLAKVDFSEYKEVVGQAIQSFGGQPCYNRIERAFVQIQAAIDSNNFALLDNAFNTCSTLAAATTFERYLFLDSISNALSGIVQYHTGTEISAACTEIMDISITDDLLAYAAFIRTFEAGSCYGFSYTGLVEYLRQTSWESDPALSSWRQWMYQTCKEYGWYQTLNSDNQPFGRHDYANVYTTQCNDVFDGLFPGSQVADNAARTNDYNFGIRPVFRNVFSTHGSLDPWSAMGLQVAPSTFSPLTIIPGASHCRDLASISVNDSTEMLAAKEQIRELVIQWLA